MLDRALVEIGERRRDGFDLSVAVNLSPADLLDLGLPSEVSRVLEQRNFPASCLRLEVSEDAVMADPERSLEVLRELRSIGVATSLDDFGSGHVSLGASEAPRRGRDQDRPLVRDAAGRRRRATPRSSTPPWTSAAGWG